MTRLVLWAHPIAGGLFTFLALRAAALGLAARRGWRRGDEARRRHRALTPWLYGLLLFTWAGGLMSTWLWRDDLEIAASGHFQVGCVVIGIFTVAALVSRRIGVETWARAVHPWIAVAGLLATGVQVFLGLQIVGQ